MTGTDLMNDMAFYGYIDHSHSEIFGYFGLFGAIWVGKLGPQPGSMGRSAPRGRPGATSSLKVNVLVRDGRKQPREWLIYSRVLQII